MPYIPLYLGQALGKLGYDISMIRRGSWIPLNKLCKQYCVMNGYPVPKSDLDGRMVYETREDFAHLEHNAYIFLGSPDSLRVICRK